jgi:hypothetical protein
MANEDINLGGSEYREGPVARKIERQTAKLPSDLFLWAAGGSILASFVAQLLSTKRSRMYDQPSRAAHLSLFIGQWAPTFLLLGVYNKIVKEMGRSDRAEAVFQ